MEEVTEHLITPHGDRKRFERFITSPNDHTTHYPSWGSETSDTDTGAVRYFMLITPHGDRKQDRIDPEPHQRCQLITPHGDRKRAGIGVFAGTVPENSLPLMGIGNSRRGRTPIPTPRSHYPSWGSETCRESTALTSPSSSLPLMGIGNRRTQSRSVPPCRISLPLMGIGNSSGRP